MQYTVVRSKRKTVALTFSAEGELVVRAPLGLATEEIEKMIARHSRWIAKHGGRRIAPPISLQDGETLCLYGQDYVIASGRARLTDGVIFLPERNREGALKRLLVVLSLQVMLPLTERIATQYGLRYQKIRISSARGRWGSCNCNQTIAYTFRLCFLPMELCEYVAVHELCHTKYMNHSALFWKEVEKILPNWRSLRLSLRKYAQTMNLLPF